MKRNLKALVSVVAVTLLLMPIFAQSAYSQGPVLTVRIRADGTVEPASVPIERVGDTYRFTADINGLIVIEKSNIVLDGAGYTLRGTYNGSMPGGWMIGDGPPPTGEDTSLWTFGIDFFAATAPTNVTIRNVNIKNCPVGMYIWTENNTIENNSVTDSIIGVLLAGDLNTITGNYIANNDEGLFLGINDPGALPFDVALARNSFIGNNVQISGCTCEEYNTTEPLHTWDDGSTGNFWSDYNGTDSNGDGVGDTPYYIDLLNLDRYPLIQPYATPLPTTTEAPAGLPLSIVLGIVVLVTFALAVVVALIFKKKGKAGTN